jgi:hypothetical protein
MEKLIVQAEVTREDGVDVICVPLTVQDVNTSVTTLQMDQSARVLSERNWLTSKFSLNVSNKHFLGRCVSKKMNVKILEHAAKNVLTKNTDFLAHVIWSIF